MAYFWVRGGYPLGIDVGPDPGAAKVYDSVVCETPLKVADANLAGYQPWRLFSRVPRQKWAE